MSENFKNLEMSDQEISEMVDRGVAFLEIRQQIGETIIKAAHAFTIGLMSGLAGDEEEDYVMIDSNALYLALQRGVAVALNGMPVFNELADELIEKAGLSEERAMEWIANVFVTSVKHVADDQFGCPLEIDVEMA